MLMSTTLRLLEQAKIYKVTTDQLETMSELREIIEEKGGKDIQIDICEDDDDLYKVEYTKSDYRVEMIYSDRGECVVHTTVLSLETGELMGYDDYWMDEYYIDDLNR